MAKKQVFNFKKYAKMLSKSKDIYVEQTDYRTYWSNGHTILSVGNEVLSELPSELLDVLPTTKVALAEGYEQLSRQFDIFAIDTCLTYDVNDGHVFRNEDNYVFLDKKYVELMGDWTMACCEKDRGVLSAIGFRICGDCGSSIEFIVLPLDMPCQSPVFEHLIIGRGN